MKKQRRLIPFVALLALGGCAESKTRLWISPPVGFGDGAPQSRLSYKVADASGKTESFEIPIGGASENLVVEDRASTKDAGVTKADEWLSRGEVASKESAGAPTLSYFRGVDEIEKLYAGRRFAEALVKLAPLVEQYPKQARLYTMQGTLYRRMGEPKMAYLALQKAHELDGKNADVAEALERAKDEMEEGG